MSDAEASGGRLEHLAAEEFVEQLRLNLANPRLRLIDVRTPEEYANQHIPGAELMNCHDLDFLQRIAAEPRDSVYLLVCRSGNRSGHVLEAMRAMGFSEGYNMLGGMLAWAEMGLPVQQDARQGELPQL